MPRISCACPFDDLDGPTHEPGCDGGATFRPKKLVAVLPVSDERAADLRFAESVMISSELMFSDPNRFGREIAAGRAAALRTPRYAPYAALLYLAASSRAGRAALGALAVLAAVLAALGVLAIAFTLAIR